ncbi:MAG: 9-O-acetylesterase [Lentisphaeria bacterium]|nr:9-O-acetylesterase [Lentisphaeria bacterium]
MSSVRHVFALISFLLLGTCLSRADVSLPKIFGNHSVLQRGEPIAVWGKADAGESIRVQLGEAAAVSTTTAADGIWRVELPAREAGGPFVLMIEGKNTVRFEDVLIGEVWLCSGQSNMAMAVASSLNFAEEKAAANHPEIRHITMARVAASTSQDDVTTDGWKVCSPDTVGGFSGAAYFFGRKLHGELGVPIGLINSSWGGTRIEPWTSRGGFEGVKELADIDLALRKQDPADPLHKELLSEHLKAVEAWLVVAREALIAETFIPKAPVFPAALLPYSTRSQPTALYNGMIHALVPYGIRGVTWYQGESNHGEGMLYYHKMRALIGGWRVLWNKPDLPFYFVQIAPYKYTSAFDVLPTFWEAQARSATIPGAGMVVISDVGDTQNIHPKNKQAVGMRLALQALARTYGRDGLVCSGPVFQEMKVEGASLRLRFAHVAGGFVSRAGEPLSHFEIHDADGFEFVAAAARIDGDEIVVTAPGVTKPVALRFGWHKLAVPNLMNKSGLPAWPFRAGTPPKLDSLKRVPAAAEYTLVYDLDLKKLARTIHYDVDNRTKITVPFDRIAYLLELRRSGEGAEYLFVSMDAFTEDLGKIGIPAIASKAHFQMRVTNMDVYTNSEAVTAGTALTGNIEFWPNNYSAENSAKIPGASATLWDFGDAAKVPVDGYGCMQVHNFAAGQTLFAINAWKTAANADLGIGNSTAPQGSAAKTRDWTFMHNANQYQDRRLRVFVRLRK